MKYIQENNSKHFEFLPSVLESQKINNLSKRLVILKSMLGISICTFVAIVTQII